MNDLALDASDHVRRGLFHALNFPKTSMDARRLPDAAKAFADVVAVRDGDFVGVAAPTAFRAQQALVALAKTAEWNRAVQPSSDEIFDYLRKKSGDRTPANPFRDELQRGTHQLHQTYRTAYVQHAPLEPRAAAAQWQDGRLTVWTGTQNPFGYQNELSRALHVPSESVRVVVPDFGSGFGGKHTAEAAIEAARLARAAGRPVSLRWTREEEFTWAYFRPAALIDIEASLDADGHIATLSQVQACILMGLGPALREAMVFENGEILNSSFAEYAVPRFSDVPELDIHLLDRPDLSSVGGGETPIIAIAPAVANAVFRAAGERRRELPVRLA